MSEFQYSERQACKRLSMDRTTYRYQPRPDHNAELRSKLLALARQKPRYGYQALHEELCKAGPDHCPTMRSEKGESHMSEVFSIDTADTTVSGPILKWIKSIK